jgi:hypothetical protein
VGGGSTGELVGLDGSGVAVAGGRGVTVGDGSVGRVVSSGGCGVAVAGGGALVAVGSSFSAQAANRLENITVRMMRFV